VLEPSRAGITAAALFLACGIASTSDSSLADELAPGVRGVATRAPQGVKIDGDLSEFRDAFVTPVEYFHDDLKNRAAQFLYMWDDEAFYAGLRTLDQKQANLAPDDRLWEGDGVEWYFDTRRGEGFRGPTWGPGAVHCYWTAYKGVEVMGRFCLRPGYLDAIPKKGVEVAARKTRSGAEVEFKLPWANFPGFQPKRGEVIGLDAELCYSDGGSRVFRTFAYGSPLSVDQPASLARVELVEKLEPGHWKACGPVLAPIRCDTAWSQKGAAQVTALMALPPGSAERIGKVLFRLTGLDGSTIREVPGEIQVFESEGDFRRAVARWPLDAAAPGSYHLTGILLDPEGKEMARVAPRLVSVNMERGY
jgi:hypothetical protein